MKKKKKKRTTPTTRTNNNNNPISSNNNKEKKKTNLQTKSNHLQHLHSYSNLKYKTFKNSNSSSQKHQQHSIYLRKNWKLVSFFNLGFNWVLCQLSQLDLAPKSLFLIINFWVFIAGFFQLLVVVVVDVLKILVDFPIVIESGKK